MVCSSRLEWARASRGAGCRRPRSPASAGVLRGDADRASTRDINSEDASLRSQAAALLIEKGDAEPFPTGCHPAEADRTVRQAIKPVIDLLKNHANLTSEQPDTRRSAAADLVGTGRPEAITWLDAAEPRKPVWWVKYTMEESAQLIQLRAADPASAWGPSKNSGQLRSQNGLSVLKEFVDAGALSDATQEQRTLAEAAQASIKQIDAWYWWASAIETLFRGISLSSILLIMSLGLAIVFGLMGVINMAHGELMMVGAYATFITHRRSWAGCRRSSSIGISRWPYLSRFCPRPCSGGCSRRP